EVGRTRDRGGEVGLNRGRDGDARREGFESPLGDRLRLPPRELDRGLARLELVEQLDAHAATSSRTRTLAGSTPASTPSSSSLSRRANCGNVSPLTRRASQPATRPSTAESNSFVRTRLNSGRPIAAPPPP